MTTHDTRGTRPRRRARALVTGVALATLVLGACGGTRPEGGATTVGVTDDSVKIGGHFPLTGVAAPGYSEIPTGAKAYYDYVNAGGGVNGRTIDYLVRDDGYDPTKTSTVTNELVLKEKIFAMVGGLGTPTHGAVVDFLNDEEVPDLFVSSGSLAWGEDPAEKPWTFGWQTDYESEGKVIGQYVKKNFPDAKVGLFLQDDDLGADGEKGLEQYIGDQVVETVRYTSGNTDVAPQISALQSSGADLVIGFNTPSYTALSQLTSLKLGFEPQWFYTNVGSDATLVGSLLSRFSEGAVKGGASSLDGVLTTKYLDTVDDADSEWIKLWKKVWEQEGDDQPLTNYRVYGMAQAYTFVQALQAAGKDLTRQGIVDALEEQGGDFEGPMVAPFAYSKDSHMGTTGMRVARLDGAKVVPETEVEVTEIGDNPIEPDSSDAGKDAPPSSGIPGQD
ncbi:ABC transporter substrate-binding protein [Nocardioides aurantiacus]|uniref:Amino acid/amide ABC transporter substrate-binding protein (HAAT family) n=1 Tax=Nocardioides aurantiacus TaxID=86796 RepID=A0A3N2CQ57_9ACTN|nr:ABC transporter substrate-binding protein [Nocardioides aurantiacus]ROR89653.1 amino acid/amide ABC transporter substrate-binding protein (HAAT family) [Nocardioides aurantiacus]